jgi:hypothetical protein
MTQTGSAVSVFGNWLALNRDAALTTGEHIVNDAVQNTYLLGEMMRGRDIMEVVRGGRYISERVKLADQGNFRTYSPGEDRNPRRAPTIRTIFFDWRFMENDIPYTDAELTLGEGDEFTRFQSFSQSLRQELKTDHFNGMEALLTARPDATLMEGIGNRPGQMNSIFHFIWEDDADQNGDFHPPGYTVIAGLNPATEERWRNAVERYDSTQIDHPHLGIFAAFDTMFLRLRFIPPPRAEDYFENDDLRKLKVLSNLDGVNLYQQLLREGNDHFRAGPQDPSYGSPVFKGIPIIWISNLDDELLEVDASNAYTGNPWPAGRPRFVCINCMFLYPVFHPANFMKVTDPVNGGIRQRDTDSLFMVSWCNVVCKSRQRQGMIAPLV